MDGDHASWEEINPTSKMDVQERVPSELELGRMSRVSAEDQPSENCLDRRRNTTDTCKRS